MGLVIIVAMVWIFGIRDEQSSKAGDIKAWYHAEFNLLSTENGKPIPHLGTLGLPYPQLCWKENGENKWRRFDYDYDLTFELGPGMKKPENPVVSHGIWSDSEDYCGIAVGSYKDNIYPKSTIDLKTSFWIKETLLDNITMISKYVEDSILPRFGGAAEKISSIKASARVTWGIIRENKKITVENLRVPPIQDGTPWSPSNPISLTRYNVSVS